MSSRAYQGVTVSTIRSDYLVLVSLGGSLVGESRPSIRIEGVTEDGVYCVVAVECDVSEYFAVEPEASGAGKDGDCRQVTSYWVQDDLDSIVAGLKPVGEPIGIRLGVV